MKKFKPPTAEERQELQRRMQVRMDAALKLRKDGKAPDYISVFPFKNKGAGAEQPATDNPSEGEGGL